MKKVFSVILSLVLAVLMTALTPAQVFADSQLEYISEVKIGMGKSGADAKAALDGYTVLSDDKGNPVDLNSDAGGGWGSDGDKVVYLGYKTTKNSKEAVTDLALMNMKGGYSVADYKALMETQMSAQIIPFVEHFQVTIAEYRDNYNSDGVNRQRAQSVHDMLNKLTDDDCDGAGLGDLLLNETKFEMGDGAYNALSESEKKNHCDILTLIAQANGQATLLMENLLTRASDTNDSSWIDRMSGLSYDDLLEATGLTPTDAARELDRLYNDDAETVLDMWSQLKDELDKYDEAKAFVDSYDESSVKQALDDFRALADNTESKEYEKAAEAFVKAQNEEAKYMEYAEIIGICEYLGGIEYSDGTLLDFFSTDVQDIEDDLTVLYPLVASLSAGQKAGLDFVSLRELIAVAATDPDKYAECDIDSLEPSSVYEGVDRTIYEKGGVALTSDALRTDAMSKVNEENANKISKLSLAFVVLTGVSVVGFIASTVTFAATRIYLAREGVMVFQSFSPSGTMTFVPRYYAGTIRASKLSLRMMAGFGVAMVVLAGITTYLTWRDMKAYYKVDFTPIPHFMVDEKDITGYNRKGEKTVLTNQAAYYKAVECNRVKGDKYFDVVGNLADMNGDVGKQWLALYAAKNVAMEPILASSLKAVVGSSEIPSGYGTGIHMFGSDAAFNLNSSLYDWNNNAPSTFVYFKTDANSSGETGSNFTGGSIAVVGGTGLAIGALATALGVSSKRKNKENNLAF